MSAERRQITLTETDDGQWRAQVEPDGLSGSGETIEEALAELDDSTVSIGVGAGTGKTRRALAILAALDEAADNADETGDVDPDAEGNEDPPAAPLYKLVGMLDDDEVDRVRERSREFREEFDERVERTPRELSDEN